MPSFPIEAPAFNGSSRVVDAGNAFEWLRQGGALFVAFPSPWIALAIVFLVIVLSLTIVPLIGTVAANLALPLLAAGLLRASQRAAAGEAPTVNDLFAGFQHHTGGLLMVGVLYMAGIGLALGDVFFAMLLSLVLSVPVLMAVWFAPALVYFNGMQPVDACKASFNACMKNVLAFVVYGLIVMILAFFAALPVFLGFLVLLPALAGSAYAAYRDDFVAN